MLTVIATDCVQKLHGSSLAQRSATNPLKDCPVSTARDCRQQAGHAHKNAVQAVLASDTRLAALTREAEELQAETERAAGKAPQRTLGERSTSRTSRQRPETSSSAETLDESGEAPAPEQQSSDRMTQVRSPLQDKLARLDEVFEELELLVSWRVSTTGLSSACFPDAPTAEANPNSVALRLGRQQSKSV